MIRPRDRKGRFISEIKFPIGIFGPKHTPQINTYDRYIGSTSRQGRVVSEWSPKEPPSPATMEQKVKQHMSIDPILNQGVDLESIHQFLNNQEEGVLSPVEPAAEDITEEFGVNFAPNPVNEAS